MTYSTRASAQCANNLKNRTGRFAHTTFNSSGRDGIAFTGTFSPQNMPGVLPTGESEPVSSELKKCATT